MIDLATFQRALDSQDRDTLWDRLEELGRAAWTWRDPESIEALATWIGRLRLSIRADWESGEQDPSDDSANGREHVSR